MKEPELDAKSKELRDLFNDAVANLSLQFNKALDDLIQRVMPRNGMRLNGIDLDRSTNLETSVFLYGALQGRVFIDMSGNNILICTELYKAS